MNASRDSDGSRLACEVRQSDYNRLLGLPRHRPLEGLVAERAQWARDWYARHGSPFIRMRRYAIVEIGPDAVRLEGGVRLASRALAERLGKWATHAVVALAATAGAEVDEASRRMWQDGYPDEAFFLERFGAAVVEQLIVSATPGGCRQAAGDHEALTPHLSPGCGSWNLGGQRRLWAAVFPAGEPGPIRVLESGGLYPKNSMLAAAGVTRCAVSASPSDACRACDRRRCAFRRAAHRPVWSS